MGKEFLDKGFSGYFSYQFILTKVETIQDEFSESNDVLFSILDCNDLFPNFFDGGAVSYYYSV